MTTTTVPATAQGGLRGAALIVAAMGVLTLNDALMRMLVAGLPLGQAVAMRGLSGCMVMLAVSPLTSGMSAFWPRSLRNVSILSTMMLYGHGVIRTDCKKIHSSLFYCWLLVALFMA